MRTAALLAVIAIAAGCAAGGPPTPDSAAGCAAPTTSLPGLQVGAAPWLAELEHLEARLQAIGGPILTREGQAIDRHAQLLVYVGGARVKVPTSIGLAGEEIAGGIMTSGFVTEMHTHDSSGVIHIHAVEERPFALGEFFDVWGVAFGADRIGGYCAAGGRTVRVFANGQQLTGDPRAVELKDGAVIAVTFGTEAEVPDPDAISGA